VADLLDTTARQVCLPGGIVHQLVADSFDPAAGRVYLTTCGCRLTGAQEAILTTRDVECANCVGRTSAAERQRQLVDSLLLRGRSA